MLDAKRRDWRGTGPISFKSKLSDFLLALYIPILALKFLSGILEVVPGEILMFILNHVLNIEPHLSLASIWLARYWACRTGLCFTGWRFLHLKDVLSFSSEIFFSEDIFLLHMQEGSECWAILGFCFVCQLRS